jgi:hypothetical protein
MQGVVIRTQSKRASRRGKGKRFLRWDSPETLAALKQRTADLATDWHFVAVCSHGAREREMAHARCAVLDALAGEDVRLLRDLASRACAYLGRHGFRAARAHELDSLHATVKGYLSPLWAKPGKSARSAIPSETIARDMVSLCRNLRELRTWLAQYCPRLFPLTAIAEPLPNEWAQKLTNVIERARYDGDESDAAEKMIVNFFITLGVPKTKARAVWDYRKKRIKRVEYT